MYVLVLFVHLVAVVTVFFVVGLMVAATGTIAKLEKSMTVLTVVLLVTGGYMTHDRWTWTTPWIDAGTAGLIAMGVFGAAFLGPRASKLHASDRVDASNALLSGTGVNVGLALGVMYLMVAKPNGLLTCVITLLIGAAVGFMGFAFAIQRIETSAEAGR